MLRTEPRGGTIVTRAPSSEDVEVSVTFKLGSAKDALEFVEDASIVAVDPVGVGNVQRVIRLIRNRATKQKDTVVVVTILKKHWPKYVTPPVEAGGKVDKVCEELSVRFHL